MKSYSLDQDVGEIAGECDVVLPGENEIQVDIDIPFERFSFSPCAVRMRNVIATLSFNGFDCEAEMSRSRNGNTHVHVRFEQPLVSHEMHGGHLMRIALQACFGSDPIREVLGVMRLVTGKRSDCPTLLFETPGAERKRLHSACDMRPKRAISFGGPCASA